MIGENPYYHRGPIKEAQYFYGRKRETTRALQMVKQGQSVSVIGPRRVGKTSFLFHLSDPAIRSQAGLVPEQLLCIYLDGGALAALSRVDILRVLLQETAVQTRNPRVAIPQPVEHHSFERAVRELVRSGQRLVYLLDEFEALGNNKNLDADFFSFLRSLTIRFNIAYVTASQIPLLALANEKGQLCSPFFNIFMPIHLGLFSEEDARCLINGPSQAAGIELSNGAVDFILELVGPHPFFLQIACYHAVELLREHPAFDERVRKQLQERVQADLTPHFQYFTGRLKAEERRALVGLAGDRQSDMPTAIGKELERKCLVRQQGSQYILVSQTFTHFVREEMDTTSAGAIKEGERRMATVLFADVVEFTPMTEQHIPEDILAIMQPALRMFVDVVDRHGGQVADFGGDSVMVVFGVPAEQPDDAVRAVRAALEIQARVLAYAYELKQKRGIDFAVRVGLDTGVVVWGQIGGEQRAECTALGDAVNLACRIQELAEPGSVAMSEHTYQQVRGWFKTETLGIVPVRGKSMPVKIFRVLGERAHKEETHQARVKR